MSVLGFRRLLDQKLHPPAPATESFAGRTILLTGATSGLGLEAAKQMAALGPDRLIITARNEQKGEASKREIEEYVKTKADAAKSVTEIVVMTLDMSSFAGVRQFVATLQSRFSRLDGVVLNAGTMGPKYRQSPDGWEETLQVNALSTLLLGVLLLPLLMAAAADHPPGPQSYTPHLTLVSSGTAWTIKPEGMKEFVASETPLEDLNSPKSFPSGMLAGATVYARSKLVLEYGLRHLAASPALKGPDGRPKVIVNTVCPGMCRSDLGRSMTTNPLAKLMSWIIYTFFARTAEQGANCYSKGLTLGPESHGQMWKNDRIHETGPMNTTEEGRMLGDKVWNELRSVLVKADPSTKAFLNA